MSVISQERQERKQFVYFYGLCRGLGGLFNLAVIIIIILTLVRSSRLRAASLPKFLAAGLCCLAQLADITTTDASFLRTTSDPETNCGLSLTALFGWHISQMISMLAIVVAFITEIMQLFKVRRRMLSMVTVVLLIVAVIYPIIVILTVGYVGLFVEPQEPCMGSNLNVLETDKDTIFMVLNALSYLVPVVALVISLIIMIIVYRSASADARAAQSSRAREMKQLMTTEASAPATHLQPDHSMGARPYAFDLQLAGLIAIILPFLKFYYMFDQDLYEKVTLDELNRLKYASEFLYMCYLILVPCCWLTSVEIRAAVCNYFVHLAQTSPSILTYQAMMTAPANV